MSPKDTPPKIQSTPDEKTVEDAESDQVRPHPPAEYGGPKGPEPTRYGDWERKGRCVDF